MSNKQSVAELFDNDGPGRAPAAQLALYNALKGNGDVPFHTLLSAVQGETVDPAEANIQQRLGSYVTRINRRLRSAKLAVRPGRLKGTYRLESL